MNHHFQTALLEADLELLEPEVIEIPLLLAGWQVSALETAAHERGLTAAEMVRQVLSDFLHSVRYESRPGRRELN
jgi:hypothetical protein